MVMAFSRLKPRVRHQLAGGTHHVWERYGAEVPSGEIQSPASKKFKVQSKAPATKKKDFKPNSKAKEYGCNVSDEEAAAIYKAIPYCFSTAPRMRESSESDEFTSRALSRIRYTHQITIAPNETYFISPSPMVQQDTVGTHQAIGAWKKLNWSAGDIACSGTVVGPPSYEYFWTSDPGLNAGFINECRGFTDKPDAAAGVDYGPVSVCGGLFCAKVMLPYDGSATVLNFGPSDVANLQGLGSGNSWRRHPAYLVTPGALQATQTPSNPRRQYRDSVNWHATSPKSQISAAVDPVMLVGSSANAVTNFGFGIVPDAMFSPISSYAAPAGGQFVAPDLYPAKNPWSGTFNGQGCIYIENTSATASMSVVIEMYVDYCVAVGWKAQRYLAEDTLAQGMEGFPAPTGLGISFPGYNSTSCLQLMERIGVERLPKRFRNDRTLECIRKLVEQQSRIAAHVASNTVQIVPFAPTPKRAFETSLLGYIKEGTQWLAERFKDVRDIGRGIGTVTRAAASIFA